MPTPGRTGRRAYVHGVGLTPLLGQTIGENLRETIARAPDAEALVVCSQGYRATYRELGRQVSLAARGLMALGVKKGDRVGIWAGNRYEWVIVQYATACLGAILVNINPAYQAPELEHALNLSGVSLLLHARGYRKLDYLAMLDGVRGRCPQLRESLLLEESWQKLLAEGGRVDEARLHEQEARLHFDEPINIQYTSGTTGLPKGATLTHHNILNNGYFVGAALGYSTADRVCIPVPFYHCFGMVLGNLACTTHGACMITPGGDHFAPEAVLVAVAEERCTSLYGVPTMFRTILECPDLKRRDVTCLRTGIMAGAPCPIELMREVIDRLHMPEVAIGYGMTETSPISTMSARDDTPERRVSTVGRVLPHVEVCIKETGSQDLVKVGEVGELCTRGTSVMRGYWNDPEATKRSIDEAGWMHSGDLATLDEEGYVHIVGRLKDMIIRGGENIYPREIEAALHSHPAVADAQVVGVPSRKYGEEVMAWVKLREGARADEQELKVYCCERMASFKVPRYWRMVETFPMTVTGKVQKFRLREMAIELLHREEDAGERTA